MRRLPFDMMLTRKYEQSRCLSSLLERGYAGHCAAKLIVGLLDEKRETCFSSVAYQRYPRSEEHTSELQSLMRISYAVFCLKKKKQQNNILSNRITYTRYYTGVPTIFIIVSS